MTQDEIIRMALEACAPNQTFNSDEEWVKRFAALVAAHEKKFWMAQIEVECNEAVLAERDKQAEQDLDTCPGCGGVADNGHDREFPPNPYYCTKCSEQAEQEPVAWAHPSGGYLSARYMKEFATGLEKETYTIPLYASPVLTKDMTDEEQLELARSSVGKSRHWLVAAVIAAYKEKNK